MLHQTGSFIVLARPPAGASLRGLGLEPHRDGDWLCAETDDADAARAALRPLPFDWSVRAANAPAPRVFVSDMDSTIIGQECIDELADFAGRKAEVAQITERAMRGELDFAASLRARVATLKGLPEATLARCMTERVRINPGAKALLAALEHAGVQTALVSGGFDVFVRPVAAEAGFRRSLSNRLEMRDGALTGRLEGAILDAAGKAAFLARLADETGATPEQTVAMGDGANDAPMLRAAGFAIAVGGREAALAEADAAVREGDLSVIIRFLALT